MARRLTSPKRALRPAAATPQLPPLQYFSPGEAALVDAITARLIPKDGASPGAREAGALIYIDRAIAGYFSSLQVLYREGLAMVDIIAHRRHGKAFVALSEPRQDEVLKTVEQGLLPDGSDRSAQFFAVIHEHTIEGTFGDPIHGGNRDFIGWKMIGFPGAQDGYSAAQMVAGPDLVDIPTRSIADIQATDPKAKGDRRS